MRADSAAVRVPQSSRTWFLRVWCSAAIAVVVRLLRVAEWQVDVLKSECCREAGYVEDRVVRLTVGSSRLFHSHLMWHLPKNLQVGRKVGTDHLGATNDADVPGLEPLYGVEVHFWPALNCLTTQCVPRSGNPMVVSNRSSFQLPVCLSEKCNHHRISLINVPSRPSILPSTIVSYSASASFAIGRCGSPASNAAPYRVQLTATCSARPPWPPLVPTQFTTLPNRFLRLDSCENG